MQIVDQLTPFTCGLTCLESLTSDFPPAITQAEMLVRYQALLIRDTPDIGNFGATTPAAIKKICDDLGFKGDWVKDHRKEVVREQLFKRVKNTESVFICSNYEKNGWHCIRFAGLKDDDTVFAMVPEFGSHSRIREVSIQNLIDWDYSFALLAK